MFRLYVHRLHESSRPDSKSIPHYCPGLDGFLPRTTHQSEITQILPSKILLEQCYQDFTRQHFHCRKMVNFFDYEWNPQLLVNHDESSTVICNLDRIALRLNRNIEWIRHYRAVKLGVDIHIYDEDEDWFIYEKDLTDDQLTTVLQTFHRDFVACHKCGSEKTQVYLKKNGVHSWIICQHCRKRNSIFIDC